MSRRYDCINCQNYSERLEIQLIDDAGHPLEDLPVTLTERGTNKSVSGTTDSQGIFLAEGLSPRPHTRTTDAQVLADRLAADLPATPVYSQGTSLTQYCRSQRFIHHGDNVAGDFGRTLPGQVYDMSVSQISRLSDYRHCRDGYILIRPYDHRRVIAVRRIAEKVYAKSVLRGAGNTDAGTETEKLDNFGRHQTPGKVQYREPAQAGIPVGQVIWFIVSGIVASISASGTSQQKKKEKWSSDEQSVTSNESGQPKRIHTLALSCAVLPMGCLISDYYQDDSLTHDDLAEKAKKKGTATTRVRIKYQENTETGEQDVVSFATKGSNDQVRVRMGIRAPESEADEIRSGSQVYRPDGLPTPQSLVTIYRFELDDGNILYLGVDTDNQFVELTSSTHPEAFSGRGWHTGSDIDPVDVPTHTGEHNPYLPGKPDSAGGFQAHQDNGPIILTNPAPDEQGFNDYILITPIADIPAIYVYLNSPFINDGVVRHSGKGDWTEANTMPPRDRKVFPNGRLSGGGHGQSGIKELELRKIEYNIEHTYQNGVRVGNIPSHASKGKRSGIGQSWFPEHWSDRDIENAGNAVWDLEGNEKTMLSSGGTMTSGSYNGVFIRVIKDSKGNGSIFPDNKIQP